MLTLVLQTVPLPDKNDPAATLAAVVALRRLADQFEVAGASTAIEQGWSWADIADALGVSRQAAHKKLANRIGFGLKKGE